MAYLNSAAALEFARGFLDGFTFFSNLQHAEECHPVDSQITQDIVDIVNILRNVTVHSDMSQVVHDVLEKANDAYARHQAATQSCQAVRQEVKSILKALKAHTRQQDYANKLLVHTMSNLATVQGKLQNAAAAAQAQDWQGVGNAVGDGMKYVAFWDFNSTSTNSTSA